MTAAIVSRRTIPEPVRVLEKGAQIGDRPGAGVLTVKAGQFPCLLAEGFHKLGGDPNSSANSTAVKRGLACTLTIISRSLAARDNSLLPKR
jgi:hypothetical protein